MNIQDHKLTSPEEMKIRQDLAAAYRLVDFFGWSDLIGTHLSARIPGTDDHFLINPYGFLFEEITASSLVKVDMNGNILSDTGQEINPAGFIIHSAVHMARPEVASVMHTHTPACVSIATQKEGLLPLTQHALAVLDHTAYHVYEGISMDEGERERIAEDFGANNILFLRNHGVLTAGKTVAETFVWLYRAERASRMQLAIQQSGAEYLEIPESIQEATIAQNRKNISDHGYRPIGLKEWPALLRRLDRIDPSYKD
ncbi:MAG: class II aldolase/adducin family protein [Methyloligellaceae bacterium]